MVTLTESRLAYGLGLVGGGLILLGSLVSLLTGMADLALGHPLGALASTATAFVLSVVGGLAMLLAYLTHREWSARPLTGGIALAALALVGWAFLGLGASVVTIVGALLVFLAGVLLAVEPSRALLPAPTTS